MILITGGTGFVGKHLCEELARRGATHRAFSRHECDLTERDQVFEMFSRHHDAELLVHLASYQAAGDFPAQHPADQFYLNNLIHVHVLEAWRRFLPHARLVAAGTSCAYPSSVSRLVEDVYMDGEVHGSVYCYAFTKRCLCRGIQAYNDQHGLNGTYLIPATMFGEYDDFDVETAHVCGALVAKFVRAVKEGLPEVEVWGDGTQVRDFMDVKQFVAALLHVAETCQRDIVNVGPGRGTSIRQLAETIRDAAGYGGNIRFNAERYTGIREKFIDAGKLAARYGWRIDADLTAGIRRTVAWYAKHYELLRDRKKFPVA